MPPILISCSASPFAAQKGRKLLIPVPVTLSASFIAIHCVVRVSLIQTTSPALSIQTIPGTWNAAPLVGGAIASVESQPFDPNVQSAFTAFPSFLDASNITAPASGYSATYLVEVLDAATRSQQQGFVQFVLTGSAAAAQSVNVVFALDYGSSMSWIDASNTTRLDRLRNAFSRAVVLFRADDTIGVATFANLTSPLNALQLLPASATHAQQSSALNLAGDLTVDLSSPFKSIEMGIDAGRALSQSATLVLVTDGRNVNPVGHVLTQPTLPTSALIIGENPYQPPASAPQMVSAGGHYAIASAQSLGEFAAEKLLTQILIGLAGNTFISDPEGSLAPGGHHSFPVHITEADRELELIVFSNGADPLDVSFPDAKVAESADQSQASQYLDRSKSVAYDAPPSSKDPDVSRGKGVLVGRFPIPALSPHDHIRGRTVVVSRSLAALAPDALVRFNLLVVAKTDLMLDANVTASGLSVGSDLLFSAVLAEYGLLWDRPGVTVTVELTHPDGGVQVIHLDESSPGRFEASLRSFRAGAYTAHFIATGQSLLQKREFRRECLRTVAVFPPGTPCCPPEQLAPRSRGQ